MEINKQAYDAYVKEVTPVHNKWLSIVRLSLWEALSAPLDSW